MRKVLTALAAFATVSCVDQVQEHVNLRAEAQNVEVVTDPPNLEVYESVGEVTSQVMAHEVGDGLRQAANDIRNQAAAKGATFVSVDDVTSRAAWDLSGRTVVTIAGTAYRPK